MSRGYRRIFFSACRVYVPPNCSLMPNTPPLTEHPKPYHPFTLTQHPPPPQPNNTSAGQFKHARISFVKEEVFTSIYLLFCFVLFCFVLSVRSQEKQQQQGHDEYRAREKEHISVNTLEWYTQDQSERTKTYPLLACSVFIMSLLAC
jgi:hypothetical protein